MTARLLVPSSAVLWGLHSSLLSPALAVILSTLYDASTVDIGWSLAVYNAGGFVASLLVPAWADRRRSYLGVMLGCGALTIALASSLALVTTLPLATVALVVLGGPAGLGTTMLFAHMRDAGSSTSSIVNTRAIISAAWMGGPPLATLLIGWFGGRGILLALTLLAVLNIATTAAMIARQKRAAATAPVSATPRTRASLPPGARMATVLILAAFVFFQATNATAMTFMTIYVTETISLPILWAGITLGVAAALEVPALVIVGRLGDRISHLKLVAVGALAGIIYYLGLAVVTGPVALLLLQVLNAVCFAAISGIGLALFQDLIPGAGLSTGLYMNTRRIGSIVSGPIIALGALPPLGQRGIFVACAVLTMVGLGLIHAARRAGRSAEAVRAAQQPCRQSH